MGSTPVPRPIRCVAWAYAAKTSDASRASGSCEVQTDSTPSRSAATALATDSSSVFTAGLKAARRGKTSAIYPGDSLAGAVHGPAPGSHRAVPRVFARARGIDPEPAALEVQDVGPLVRPFSGLAAPRHGGCSPAHLPAPVDRDHPWLLHCGLSWFDQDRLGTTRHVAARGHDPGGDPWRVSRALAESPVCESKGGGGLSCRQWISAARRRSAAPQVGTRRSPRGEAARRARGAIWRGRAHQLPCRRDRRRDSGAGPLAGNLALGNDNRRRIAGRVAPPGGRPLLLPPRHADHRGSRPYRSPAAL